MNSMTGFGKAEMTSEVGRFNVEISGVNSRFLEMSVRIPRNFSVLESRVRELLSKSLSRGKVNIWVGFEEPNDSPSKYLINKDAFRAYYHQLDSLRKELKLEAPVTSHDILLLPDVSHPERENIDEEEVWPPMKKAIELAIKQVLSMRQKEGAAMKKDMADRLKTMTTVLKDIKKSSAASVIARRAKLNKKIHDLLEPGKIENLRIEEEIAVLAERVDIAEECTRLDSHFKQYKSCLIAKEPIGKKLNFILQEMNREANTIASKSIDFGISSHVIQVKDELEKIREMVQNVE